MKNMMKEMVMKLKGQKGATMVEYAIMIAVIAVIAMVGAGLLGTATNDLFTTVAGKVK